MRQIIFSRIGGEGRGRGKEEEEEEEEEVEVEKKSQRNGGKKLQSLVARRSEGKPVRGMGYHGLEWGEERKRVVVGW